MKVLVVGANGQIGRKLVRKLADHNHQVLAMIRNQDQAPNVEGKNVTPVVADLEKDISHVFTHKPDAVVFTAGSGGHTGPDKTRAVDLQGARKTIDEAVKNKVDRYVMVSALGANDAQSMPENMRHYFVAKSEADQHLVHSALNYTILRPGRLTNDSGNGQVALAENIENPKSREVSRTDVATVIAEIIDKRNTHKKVLELVEGPTPVPDAVRNI